MITKQAPETLEIINGLNDKMASKQAEIDAITPELQNALEVVAAIREKIKPFREGLSPLAEALAGVANPNSRDKYFPDFTKTQMIEHAKSLL